MRTVKQLKMPQEASYRPGVMCRGHLKGCNIQHSGHKGPNLSKLKKKIEMQLVRPTEVCGKV